MMRHPDREMYEIDYYSEASGKGEVRIISDEGQLVHKFDVDLKNGGNVISFYREDVIRGKVYKLRVKGVSGSQKSIDIKLN